MSFRCLECSQGKPLRITGRIELAPDARSDEISLQIIHCSTCGFQGLAVYEESSRGALGSESVDHYGYAADSSAIQAVRSLIKQCPAPGNANCKCASHQELNRLDPSGRWIKPGYKPGLRTFPILF
jgi:hypothetical protein